jgi:hypothetical protein
MTARRAGAFLAGGVVIVAAALAASPGKAGFAPVEVHAHPIATFQIGETATRFGALEFLGGLTLSSPDPDFGSWSGLDFAPDGKTLYAVSDTGLWFTTRLIEDNGRLTGIDAPMIARMLGDNGRPLRTKQNADAEGLRIVERDGALTALVSFEQTPAVRLFAMAPDVSDATPRRFGLPPFVNRIRTDQGLEAIAVAPPAGRFAGATVVLAERSLDKNHNHRGFVLDGPLAGAFSVVRTDDFDITDAAFLRSGDLLVLERRFSLATGLAMRIRRFDGASIAPGATVDGTVLVEAAGGYQIDNMEGLAVRESEDGRIVLDLISDDNQNLLQRTVLLQFALKPVPPPLPRLSPRQTPSSPPSP